MRRQATAILLVLGIGVAACRIDDRKLTLADANDDRGNNTGTGGQSSLPRDAALPIGPSCAGLADDCGPNGDQSCCDSRVVPGGTFDRDNDPQYPATVADFRLDTYEITVGRFRKFVAAYPQSAPAPKSGANPSNPLDNGWDSSWTALLPTDQAALKADLLCGSDQSSMRTWMDSVGNSINERRPINCLTWYEAQAFCVWDGGRLPSEAEWNYAAAGGDQQRPYPWSNSPLDTTIDETYASYACSKCSLSDITRVGARSPQGDGRWGHADLAGNLLEWTHDWWGTLPAACDNCTQSTPEARRVLRGGSIWSGATVGSAPSSSVTSAVLTSYREGRDPSSRVNTFAYYGNELGARCARKP